MTQPPLKGRVRVYLAANGFRYTGTILYDEPETITLADERDGLVRTFRRDALALIEQLEEHK